MLAEQWAARPSPGSPRELLPCPHPQQVPHSPPGTLCSVSLPLSSKQAARASLRSVPCSPDRADPQAPFSLVTSSCRKWLRAALYPDCGRDKQDRNLEVHLGTF